MTAQRQAFRAEPPAATGHDCPLCEALLALARSAARNEREERTRRLGERKEGHAA